MPAQSKAKKQLKVPNNIFNNVFFYVFALFDYARVVASLRNLPFIFRQIAKTGRRNAVTTIGKNQAADLAMKQVRTMV